MPKLPKSEKWIAHVECGVCGHSDALVKLDRRQYPYVYCPSCKSGIPTRSDKADRSIRSKMRLIDRPKITSESHSLESSSHQRVPVTSDSPSLVTRHSLVTHPPVTDPPETGPPLVSAGSPVKRAEPAGPQKPGTLPHPPRTEKNNNSWEFWK